jgi:hypothetical protein
MRHAPGKATGTFGCMRLAGALALALCFAPRLLWAADLGIEALLTGSAVTSKSQGQTTTTYSDQAGSGVGALVRVRGGAGRDLRWIGGLLAEQLQHGAVVGTGADAGSRLGGQVGLGWMAADDLRLEFMVEAGARRTDYTWFKYVGIRPGVTKDWVVGSRLGVVANLGMVWRKELQENLGPMAPAGAGELGATMALGLRFE